MKNKKNHSDLLEEVFHTTWNSKKFPIEEKYKKQLLILAHMSEKQKAMFAVLTTLLIHKIINPKQDIRKHQSSMKGGFSGRSIDTKYITPALKRLGLPAMAESGWLTRSLEQPYPYDKKYRGRIGNPKLKKSFLEIIEYIQNNPKMAKNFVIYLICEVKKKFLPEEEREEIDISTKQNIETIINFLTNSFNYKYRTSGGAKLPVIALHSIFSILIKELKRYDGCVLKPLGRHTASDRTSKTSGDIEILNKSKRLEETIEIKFNKPITPHIMRNIRDKIKKHKPKRYCVFSNKSVQKLEEVTGIKNEIIRKYECQVIVNGIYQTIRYYLRLISNEIHFLDIYLKQVSSDEDLKLEHKKYIKKIFKTLKIN